MTGFPSLTFALLQGLLTAVILLTPMLALPLSARLRTSLTDIGLGLLLYPMLALTSAIVFWGFEGDWADRAFGSLIALRSLLVGGFVMAIGMALTQRRTLARRPASEAAMRIGAAFLVGAVWGAAWGFSGWCLLQLNLQNLG